MSESQKTSEAARPPVVQPSNHPYATALAIAWQMVQQAPIDWMKIRAKPDEELSTLADRVEKLAQRMAPKLRQQSGD